MTRIGVNHATLGPGAASSMRHWHAHEDELACVLAGELVLTTHQVERSLRAGQRAALPAGHRDGHQLLNRSVSPAVHLEINNRDTADTVEYPDVDLRWSAPDVPGRHTHKDRRR